MKNLIFKEKLKQRLVKKQEIKNRCFNFILQNLKINKKIRQSLQDKKNSFDLKSKITKLSNRCVLSNRGRAVFRQYKMSRIMFRQLSSNGQLFGVRKSSW